ncbi:hypothetical protein ALC57_12597, partial [Trachymyrmex cornetzi]
TLADTYSMTTFGQCLANVGTMLATGCYANLGATSAQAKLTMSPRSQDTVESIVQSLSATMHSYTIIPIISASGLFKPANVYIAASKSGKLTDIVLQEFMPKKDKDIRILTIPKRTGMVQPLDVYEFMAAIRLWKNFVKTFSDRVMLLNYNINLHLRNNIIKLQISIHSYDFNRKWFQQDEAIAHFRLRVRRLLNETFPNR